MAIELNKKITSTSHSRTNEVVAVVFMLLAVLIFLCLVSYSPDDRSIISTGVGAAHKTQNWIGPVGVNIAAILISAIGWTAYITPALLALVGWRVFRSETLMPRASRVAGFFLFIVSIASLVNLFGGYGAIIGTFFADIFASLLGRLGAGILLVALLATSILLFTKLSFVSFFDNLQMPLENLKIRFNDWRKRRTLARQEAARKSNRQSEKRVEKTPTKIPTISNGENASVNPKDKSKTVGESLSAIFGRFGAAKEQKGNSPETIETAQSETDEKPIPTISVFEEPAKTTEQISENEEIPITPISETGELNGGLLNEPEDDEDAPAPQPKKPQNYNDYILPFSSFLNPPPPRVQIREDEARALAKELEEKTKEFNATGRVVNICPGPVVTTYEFKPDPGVKYSRITNLSDDLCLALEAESIRIDRIPGKAFVGIEVPNTERDTIHLREVVESKKFEQSKSLLTIALGKTIDGLNYVADLAKMPHLLIAGATGAGKSVGVNTLVVSILYKAKPDEVKFIMVDPKRLELGLYADIPHLATPIITDPKRAAISLKWAVSEMEKRYKDLAGWGVRNIDGFNTEVEKKNAAEIYDDNGEPHKKLPYIVIIIDELADLMMVSGKEVEESITRLAQMARAVGIHLVLATQRPSVDVITGLIKANFPARISFRVSSKVDSRTIIDSNGAESLLGKGDMLFLPPATSQIVRVHGAFVDEKEIAKIVDHIKAQGNPEYDTTITKTDEELTDVDDMPGRRDVLFADALRTVVSNKSASTSLLQRHLRIGYGRAAAILDAMVREGYIGEMDGSKRARPILQKAFDDLQDLDEGRDL
ncbi:MAG: DNA translocase FtsK [Pyrinomonadaceae bacterium]